MALDPTAPKIASTSFYMIGTSHQLKRFSASTDMFLIDRQHEDVYDPDNGTMQYQGPSRSYGWEAKASAQVTAHIGWNAGLTQVSNAFFMGTAPRQYVDSAPHSVGNSSLTLSEWHGLYSSFRYRHIGGYLIANPDDTYRFRRLRHTPTRIKPTQADWTWWTLRRPRSWAAEWSGTYRWTI